MNALATFDFETQAVRAVEIDGAPWFVGKDVCAALGIADHHQALARLDEDEKGRYNIPTLRRGEQELKVVSEPGVYRLIFTSRTEPAERFKRWLAHEVLPALRRTGRYEIEGISRKGWPTAAEEASMAAMLNALCKIRGPGAANDYYDRSPFPKLGGRGLTDPLLEPTAPGGDLPEPLRLLLAARLLGGRRLAEEIELALGGDERSLKRLLAGGVLVAVPAKHRGFVALSLTSEIAEEAFAASRWRKNWAAALGRLPGARRSHEALSFGAVPRRCLLLPTALFQETAE